MGKFAFKPTPIEGVMVIEPTVFGDERGYFMESYNRREFEAAGIGCTFLQDNQSLSRKGILRGLHMQKNYRQAKLVRAISGVVFDVCVDVRPGSATFGQWYGVELSGENRRQFYVPRGLLHGFLVLSDSALFAYKCDEFYGIAQKQLDALFDATRENAKWLRDTAGIGYDSTEVKPMDAATSYKAYTIEGFKVIFPFFTLAMKKAFLDFYETKYSETKDDKYKVLFSDDSLFRQIYNMEITLQPIREMLHSK